MIEEKEMAMVSPTAGDLFHKSAYFLKPILPNSSIAEPPLCFSSLPLSSFDPKKLELHLPGWRRDHHDLQSWFLHLAPKYQSTWKKAGVDEAIFISMYKIKRTKDLLCAFAERWCCETNTFVFTWGETTITLEDVMVLGGFSVLGDSVLSPLESRELKEIQDRLEVERMGLYNYRCGVRNAGTDLWMKKFMKSGNELEHEAFLVFWLSRYVFRSTSKNSVNKAVLSIAIRLARGIRVALAPAVLAHIYKDLSLLNRTIVSSKLNAKNAFIKLILKSQLQLVQVWAWERILELRPKSNVMCDGEPRVARWEEVECLNVGDMRRVLDSAGEGFMWRPYGMAIKNWIFPKYYVEKEEWVWVGAGLDDELLSFAMCLRVTELVGFGSKQKYLPHRVARQFGFDQDLPCSVFGSSYNYQSAKLYIPSRLSEADVTIRYLNWWKETVSGLQQKCIPPKKRAKKAVIEIYDATIPYQEKVVKQECASSSSLFEEQKCTSSGSLFAEYESASISPSISDEGTCVNTKALIRGCKGMRKMKTVMKSKARKSSLFEKRDDGSSNPSFEKRVSELNAKVKRLGNVVQVLKENTFGRTRLIES